MCRTVQGDNSIKPLSFSELGFKERQHLQESIAKYSSCLGEDLLIIQKELARFSDTNEESTFLWHHNYQAPRNGVKSKVRRKAVALESIEKTWEYICDDRTAFQTAFDETQAFKRSGNR